MVTKLKKSRIYRLSGPCDGKMRVNDTIARFPIGLPVKLLEVQSDRFIVQEPRGSIVEFPLKTRWTQKESELFVVGEGIGETLEEFINEELANKEWKFHSEPSEAHSIVIDDIRSKYRIGYCDYEALWGIPARTIKEILKVVNDVCINDPQELKEAVAEVSILIISGDGEADRTVDDKQFSEYVYGCVSTIYEMLTTIYFVKSGGKWDFEKGTYIHDDVTIDKDFDWKAYYKEVWNEEE